MDFAEIILFLVNLCLGIGFAIHLSRHLKAVNPQPHSFFRYFIMFVGMYFIECVAIVVAMLLPVFSLSLAFVWGIVFGLWLRESTSVHKVLKIAFHISLYTSFPAASFILVPIIGLFAGWDVLSTEEAIRFGIPDFLYWPLNTILGFYVALSVGIIVLKTAITTGSVSLLILLKKRPDSQ